MRAASKNIYEDEFAFRGSDARFEDHIGGTTAEDEQCCCYCTTLCIHGRHALNIPQKEMFH